MTKNIRSIFSNGSATGCLLGNFFRNAGLVWASVFAATFLRVRFGISLADAAAVILICTLLHALGGVAGGQVVEGIGRKRMSVASFTIAAVLVGATVFAPDIWISIAFLLVASSCVGLGMAGTINMTIEQIPGNKGTIMSLSVVFVMLGTMTGTAIGGAVLAFTSNYQATALVFVALYSLAAGIYLFFTKDPCPGEGSGQRKTHLLKRQD